jgi:translocation and assembly module TamB
LLRIRWLRIVLWTQATLLGLALCFALALGALLRTQRFHDYLLTQVRQSASQALGVPVELQNYAVHFAQLNPSIDLYGLVVHGAAPFTASPPLLQVEHARIAVRVVSFLRKNWYLSEVTVDHAVAQILVDANGNNNLPAPPVDFSTGMRTTFYVAIRHAAVEQSEIYYNNRKCALDAQLRDVTLSAGFISARNVYAGQLAYSDGHLKSGAYEPIPHSLSAEFELTPARLILRNAEVRSGASAIDFTATVDDFSNPRVAAGYHARIDAAQLRQILHNSQLPLGMLQLDGRAEYAEKPNLPAMNGLTLIGTLRSEQLEFREQREHDSGMRVEARAIRASYSLSNGDAELRSLTASLLGGTMEARATVRNLLGEQLAAAHLSLNGISLASLKQLAGSSSPGAFAGDVTLEGTLQGKGDASWQGSLRNLLATGDAVIVAAAGSPHSPGALPLAGEIHASFRNRDQQLTLSKSYLRTPQSTLTLDGTAGQHSQMKLSLVCGDLHEVETIASIFGKPPQPLGLHGSASFSGTLSGPVSSPLLTGELSSTNLGLRGSNWTLLRAHLEASPDAVEIERGQLIHTAARGTAPGNVIFSGRAALHSWHYEPANSFQISLHAERLDAGELAKLAGVMWPRVGVVPTLGLSGTVNAVVQANGSELNPLGHGQLELKRASIGGEPVQSVTVQFNGDGNAVHANLNLAMAAGAATAIATYYPRQRSYEVQLESDNFKLERLQAVKRRNLAIAGTAKLTASGRGTLEDPQLTASLEVPHLRAQEQSIDQVAITASVSRRLATISLNTRMVNADIRGQATIELSGDYLADATVDTESIALRPLLATYAPDVAAKTSGQTELHVTLHGPLKHPESIQAHLIVPELSLHYQNSVDLAASGPIHADYANGVLSVARAGLKGTGTDLQFQGSLPLLDRTKPVTLLLLGSVDLRLVQLFDPDVSSSGQLLFNINSNGVRSDPNFEGEVRIVNASFAVADAPVGLSNGNGTLALTRNRLNITNFEGSVGGGRVIARGGVVYRPSLQFDVALSGQGIRMLYPDGVREALNANLALTGSREQATLRGQVNVDQLSFAPDFDLSKLVLSGNQVEEPPSRGFASNLRLNIALTAAQNVNVVSRLLSASGTANLRVAGTAAQPVLLGRASLTGGDLVFQGNRYILQNGVIDFVNPSRTEMNVNASLTTTIQQYNIGIHVEGPPDRLRTSYSSDPPLPPADIINLIAFGQTKAAAGATATTSTQTAEQSIASAVSSQVTGRVQNIAGLSHLSMDPTLGNSQQNAGATVTVQKRVTGKIFVTFSTDVTSTQRQVIQLEYQATPQVSLSGTRDQNGGFALETRITKEW